MSEYLSEKLVRIRFLLIVFIVFLHSFNLPTIFFNDLSLNYIVQIFITNGIARIAVPMFFAISGYLFYMNTVEEFQWFIGKYRKRIFSLLIPYLFWNCFWITMLSVPQIGDFLRKYGYSLDTFDQIIRSILYTPIPFQLWFIMELIRYVIFSPLIYFVAKKLSYWSLLPLVVLWFFDLSSPQIYSIAHHFGNLGYISFEGILFYMIGALFAIKKFKVPTINNCKFSIMLTLLWIIVIFLGIYLYNFGKIENALYLYKISILLGSIASWVFYDAFIANSQFSNLISKIAPYTVFIFFAHEPLLTIIRKTILNHVEFTPLLSILLFILEPIAIIAVLICLGSILQKKFGVFYQFITGR